MIPAATADAIEERPARAVLVFGVALCMLAALVCAAPALVAKRFSIAHGREQAVLQVLHAAWPALLTSGLGALLVSSRWFAARRRLLAWLLAVLAISGYVGLTTCLADWIVDDAAITFAYSKNLASGHGLVIHPAHVPEEGYSNTLWMLFLAAVGFVGADIAHTAKLACVLCGSVAVALSCFLCQRLSGSCLRFGPFALGMCLCLGAPFVVWSCSGLEHSAQACLLAAVAAAPCLPGMQRVLIATALSGLVLLRPEAPLIVFLVGSVLVLEGDTWAARRAALSKWWPVLAAPIVTYLGLAAFRWSYFHDLLPNPYYVKAEGATWIRIFNFVGGGWGYVSGWLSDSRAWLIVPLLLVVPWRRTPLSHKLAVAMCAGQLGFVLFASGDWMGCYRFMAPALPLLAAVVVHSVTRARERWDGCLPEWAVLALVWFLGIGSLTQLMLFRNLPTTPAAVVAQIGKTFVELGRRLGIDRPVLAHHDAGGTSYEAGIELVDLGGLADRAVAKHMHDREFMREYLFEKRRPTFVFGSTQFFAAGATQFYLMPEFREYVRLEFPGRPYMKSDLCHVRRDAIHTSAGIREELRDGEEYWVVEPLPGGER